MAGQTGLVKQIDQDVVAAMKARESVRLETLRMVKSALKNKEIDKREPLTEDEAQAVLATLIKQRRDSIEQFTKGGRQELADKEAGEIVLIETYLPKALSADELKALVAGVVEGLAATGERPGPKQMGPVIKAVQEKIKAEGIRAEGREVSEAVKAALAG